MIPYSAATAPVKELYDAVKAGDLGRTRELLARGASPNAFGPEGRTPLIIAASAADSTGPAERLGCLGWLFRKRRPQAVSSPAHEMVRALLEAGADPGWRSFIDWTALMHAAAAGNASGCAELLAAGAAADLQNHKGRTALMLAAYKRRDNVLRQLIESGAQVNLADADGRTALDLLGLRKRDTSPNASHSLLKKARAKSGKGPRRRRLGTLRRHYALDELTQFQQRPLKRRWLMYCVCGIAASLLLVTGLETSVASSLLGVMGLSLSLIAFPAILQLPYVLLTRGTRRKVQAKPAIEPDRELTTKGGAESLDYVSNFVRLGWNSLAHTAREGRETRLRHTFSYLASVVLAVLIPVAFSSAGFFEGEMEDLAPGVPLLVLLLALMLEGRLRAGRLNARQAQKDRTAAELARSMEERLQHQTSETGGFVLYLRTFGVTGKLDVGGIDLETAIAFNLAPMLPIVALGKPGEAFGAGRILTTDEHWKEEILRLIKKAAIIMLIPSHREGTLWEITQLRDRTCLDKTIFVMPPETEIGGDGTVSQDWSRAVEAALGLGLFLPPYYARGLLFKLDAAGQLEQHAPFAAEQFLNEFLPEGSDDDGDDDGDESDGDDGDGDGGAGDGDSGDGGN